MHVHRGLNRYRNHSRRLFWASAFGKCGPAHPGGGQSVGVRNVYAKPLTASCGGSTGSARVHWPTQREGEPGAVYRNRRGGVERKDVCICSGMAGSWSYYRIGRASCRDRELSRETGEV